MDYSNFKNPFGLLKSMLLSKNKTAYSILIRELPGKILVPIDFLLRAWENKIMKKSKNNSTQPIILLLGGSRSGTPFLYLTLVHYLAVNYASVYRSPITAHKLFNKIIPKYKTSFELIEAF